MSAVLQFEVKRRRFLSKQSFVCDAFNSESPDGRLLAIAMTAAKDTLRNGGTFVLVASDDTVTMIQRDDADEIGGSNE